MFDAFSNDFLLNYCETQMQGNDPFKVDHLLELVIQRLFCDFTAEVPDYRVVTIQERFIKKIIDKTQSIQEVMEHPLLLKFFIKLTEGNEARRCLHYLFRIKCERIDTSFFTVKNLQKTYLRYRDIQRANNGQAASEETKDVFDSGRDSQSF